MVDTRKKVRLLFGGQSNVRSRFPRDRWRILDIPHVGGRSYTHRTHLVSSAQSS